MIGIWVILGMNVRMTDVDLVSRSGSHHRVILINQVGTLELNNHIYCVVVITSIERLKDAVIFMSISLRASQVNIPIELQNADNTKHLNKLTQPRVTFKYTGVSKVFTKTLTRILYTGYPDREAREHQDIRIPRRKSHSIIVRGGHLLQLLFSTAPHNSVKNDDTETRSTDKN